MPIELECKVRVSSHAGLREKMRSAGAVFISKVAETNTLFDLPDRSLQRAGCGLRVRSTVTVEGQDHGATLTFKGARTPGAFKRREEIELTVGDAAAMAGVLRALGYTERIIFEKRRESWRLGACRIELDEMPRLGLFVEVEGPDESAIRSALAALGLAENQSIIDSYASMVANLADRDDARPIMLRFE
ncbi:MAG TPA: class IV adenylate cyclase [Phycisphaerae bacterium]|nr:class IV adenylate cyclase [Phycisphaerae bacterium]